jgi:hypothetical protein
VTTSRPSAGTSPVTFGSDRIATYAASRREALYASPRSGLSRRRDVFDGAAGSEHVAQNRCSRSIRFGSKLSPQPSQNLSCPSKSGLVQMLNAFGIWKTRGMARITPPPFRSAAAGSAATGMASSKPSRHGGPGRSPRRTPSTAAAKAPPVARRCRQRAGRGSARATRGSPRSGSDGTKTTGRPAYADSAENTPKWPFFAPGAPFRVPPGRFPARNPALRRMGRVRHVYLARSYVGVTGAVLLDGRHAPSRLGTA